MYQIQREESVRQMNNPKIINIQKYSIHDGPGIRTTVFFKGCPLSCAWCHNPESQSFQAQVMFDGEKCAGCGMCAGICRSGAVTVSGGRSVTDTEKCVCCGECLDFCVNGARSIAGKEYTVTELLREIEKDQIFYETSGGGVTLSGGEVMVQDMDYIEALCRRLRRRGYHIAVDTCGYAPQENFARLLSYVDLFLYDIKLLDDEKHRRYTGQSNAGILENLRYLSENGADIQIRIPVIGGVNDTEEELGRIAAFLREQVMVRGVKLLPYHKLGAEKYGRLGMERREEAFYVPSGEQMCAFEKLFEGRER